ncbi:hypothetical protein [Paraburkholderia sp. MM6662-R1]|uniref:hypothetical protein n=1 Tax=Paraburkholderia sp. MM6662-R1 TaxID=2991066 RepID=UPI003D1C4BE2
MTESEYLDRICDDVVRCTRINNRAERIAVQRGTLEAMGHIGDPGINTDDRAFKQGWEWLCIECGPLPVRFRRLFAAGFWGVIASYRAHSRARQEQAR